MMTDKTSNTVVKTLEECIVEPNSFERTDGQPGWCSRKNYQNQKKRNYSSSCSSSMGGEKMEPNLENDVVSPKARSCNNSCTFDHAVDVFLSSGCCIIPKVLPTKFVSKCKEKATADLEYLNTQLQNRKSEALQGHNEHLLARVARGDFRELVDRDGGRRDVRFQLDRPPFTSPCLVYNSMTYSLVKELLGDGNGEINLLYAGIMWALPVKEKNSTKRDVDTASQKWHADGGHLFDHIHLPPHCINVFYPLVNLTQQNGPTEVLPGTHINNTTTTTPTNTNPVSLCCQAGDAILFDYRLQHRGRANFTNEPRPILYFAYAKSFFRDAGNTRSGHSLVTPVSLSPPWVSRTLKGDPVPFGTSFYDDEEWIEYDHSSSSLQQEGKQNSVPYSNTPMDEPTKVEEEKDYTMNPPKGSGEKWILFKMNIELPNHSEAKVITVHHGDVAMEVSANFCRENNLSNDFIPILGESIQTQINAASVN